MTDFHVNMTEVENKARQLRAEAMRNTFAAISTRLRALFAFKGTQNAH